MPTEPPKRRRARRVSSATWQGLSAAARCDLWTSDYLRSGTVEEPSGIEALEQLYGVRFEHGQLAALRAFGRAAFMAGAEREPGLETAFAAERAIRVRLEIAMREHGIPVPTDHMPSEPPEGT